MLAPPLPLRYSPVPTASAPMMDPFGGSLPHAVRPAPIGPTTAPNMGQFAFPVRPAPVAAAPARPSYPSPVGVPMVNFNGNNIPLNQFYQQMVNWGQYNPNDPYWRQMDQMYGNAYRTGGSAPNRDPYSSYLPSLNQPVVNGNENMSGGLRGGQVAPSNPAMGPYANRGAIPSNLNPWTGQPNQSSPTNGAGYQNNSQVNNSNLAFLGGRHLPVRRTLFDINTNSQELPLMMGILSAAGIDPNAAMGEFRAFLPQGGKLPATVF